MSAAITSLGLDTGALPVIDCTACGSRSLTWLDVGGESDLLRCLSCDAAVDAGTITLEGRRSVERLGYVFLDDHRKSKKAAKLSGCGAGGVKSCGSGGCSSGGCSSGGCSSGGCGSR
jgi:hypothetical protein